MQDVRAALNPTDAPLPNAALDAAEPDAARLAELLELEFEALKRRDLEQFESLQTEKNAVLERLSAMAAWVNAQAQVPAAWQVLRERLQSCREAHLRNAQLLQRQLDGVRGALQALQGEQVSSVDLYDRLGQVSRRAGAWYQHLA